MNFKYSIIIVFLYWCFFISGLIFPVGVIAQRIPAGMPLMEETFRRMQLYSDDERYLYSFNLRPVLELDWKKEYLNSQNDSLKSKESKNNLTLKNKSVFFQLLPAISQTRYQHPTPYPSSGYLINSNGGQYHIQLGAYFKFGPIHFQFQPAFRWIENKILEEGMVKSVSTEYFLNYGDGVYNELFKGQSSITIEAGSFSLGVSNENIWWGPGQWNSLTFSNNSFGFPHLFLKSRRPAKTFLGSFEGQLLMGSLKNSGFSSIYFEERRYLNALLLSYSPKWVPGLSIGFSRTFQQYESFRENSFESLFPVFSPVQKIRYGFSEDLSNQANRDQQITIFTRYVFNSALAEFYAEFGRRDHALNWREAILNPEHARAFLLGFNKLIPFPSNSFLQIRSEILHQQSSINRFIRYRGRNFGLNWSGHGIVREGFTHRGQMMSSGIGPGSNIQILELARVKNLDKIGFRLERLARYQDFFVTTYSFNNLKERNWVDLSMVFLFDKNWGQFAIQSEGRITNSYNKEWKLNNQSTVDFPKSSIFFSYGAQLNILYFFGK